MKNFMPVFASALLFSVLVPGAPSASSTDSKPLESPGKLTLPGIPAPMAMACQVGWRANDDYVTTAKDTPVTISPLANDDDNNQQNFGGIYSPPQHGTAEQVSLDHVKYTPNPGFTGTDSFTYEHIGCLQCYGEGRNSWCSEPSWDIATVYITVTN